MIKKLNHKNFEVATKIRDVFQVSYAVEAKLLKAKEFPPLKRTLNEFLECKNEFHGFFVDKSLAAVIEIITNKDVTHLQSLVVAPHFFRQGIAQKLIDFVFKSFESELITVETGAENHPAIALYKKNGFVLIDEWMTEFEIRKARFERNINS